MKKETFERIFLYKDETAEDVMKTSLRLGLKQLKEIENILHESGISIDNEVLSNCILIKRVERQGKEIEHKYLGVGSYNKTYQVITAWENTEALDRHFEQLEKKRADNGLPNDDLEIQKNKLYDGILRYAKINEKYLRREILLDCTEAVNNSIQLKPDFQEIIDSKCSVYVESVEALNIMKEHERVTSVINGFIATMLNGDVFDVEDLFLTDSLTGKIVPRLFNYNIYAK